MQILAIILIELKNRFQLIALVGCYRYGKHSLQAETKTEIKQNLIRHDPLAVVNIFLIPLMAKSIFPMQNTKFLRIVISE